MRPVLPHPASAMKKVATEGHFPMLLTVNEVSLVRDAGLEGFAHFRDKIIFCEINIAW